MIAWKDENASEGAEGSGAGGSEREGWRTALPLSGWPRMAAGAREEGEEGGRVPGFAVDVTDVEHTGEARREAAGGGAPLLALDADQNDALQEVVNIGMGRAGDSLARIFDVFVRLSIPRVRLICASHAVEHIAEFVDVRQPVTAVRQAFFGDIRGESLLFYAQQGCNELADLMGYDHALDATEERELLLDVSNVLAGACLCGIADQLRFDLHFTRPSLMSQGASVAALMEPRKLLWSHALIFEVNFRLEDRGFVCHLLAFLPETSIECLCQAVVRLMEAL